MDECRWVEMPPVDVPSVAVPSVGEVVPQQRGDEPAQETVDA